MAISPKSLLENARGGGAVGPVFIDGVVDERNDSAAAEVRQAGCVSHDGAVPQQGCAAALIPDPDPAVRNQHPVKRCSAAADNMNTRGVRLYNGVRAYRGISDQNRVASSDLDPIV